MKIVESLMTLSTEEQVLLWENYYIITKNTRLLELDNYRQHGKASILIHCIAVTYYSVLFAKRFRIRCNEQSLIIGALFHDYFLYDWHEKDKSHRLHGFFHPKKAFENASSEFEVNEIERDIIRRHMFPLTFIPPRYKEGLIVSFIDKLCSTYETFSKKPYEKLILEVEEKIYKNLEKLYIEEKR